MNKSILYGKIMTELKLEKTDSNISVCNFTISAKRGKYYTYIPCVTWKKNAENLVKYMTKGGTIIIEDGYIQSRQVTLKDGFSYQALTVVAETIKYVNSGHKDEASQGELGEADPITKVDINEEDPFSFVSNIEISDDDLPFG